jgi:hypothetical protein
MAYDFSGQQIQAFLISKVMGRDKNDYTNPLKLWFFLPIIFLFERCMQVNNFFVRLTMPLIMTLSLSGCGTLLGSKFYNIDIHPKKYNDTHHNFTEYTNTVLLSENIDGSHNFITNGSTVFLLVAGTGNFNKENINQRLKPFYDFLTWAKLEGSESENKRNFYNMQTEMKRRHIEFRYFPDGTPAFVDTNDGLTDFEKAIFQNFSDYYTPQQIAKLVLIAISVTYQGEPREVIK